MKHKQAFRKTEAIERWPEKRINEYIRAIDPEYYTDKIISEMSKENKIALIQELEYNHLMQNR